MKKHNEGYTLPLVMVVLLVLAIVAVTIMTTSLKNMQRQQGFIETMKAQYAAQGQIEAIVGQLMKAEKPEDVAAILDPYTAGKDNVTANSDNMVITVKSISGGVTINCVINLTVDAESGNKIEYTSYEIIKGGAAQ